MKFAYFIDERLRNEEEVQLFELGLAPLVSVGGGTVMVHLSIRGLREAGGRIRMETEKTAGRNNGSEIEERLKR